MYVILGDGLGSSRSSVDPKLLANFVGYGVCLCQVPLKYWSVFYNKATSTKPAVDTPLNSGFDSSIDKASNVVPTDNDKADIAIVCHRRGRPSKCIIKPIIDNTGTTNPATKKYS